MWQCLEGPAGGSLTPVKARAAFEGCAHAVRGFPGGESTREVWRVGGTVVITVPSTSGLGIAGSHSVITVSGMAELWPELADAIPVTAAVRSGGLTPSDPSVAVELLAFNASVQQAGEQTGH